MSIESFVIMILFLGFCFGIFIVMIKSEKERCRTNKIHMQKEVDSLLAKWERIDRQTAARQRESQRKERLKKWSVTRDRNILQRRKKLQ